MAAHFPTLMCLSPCLAPLQHYCPVCAYHEWNLDGLVEMVSQSNPAPC